MESRFGPPQSAVAGHSSCQQAMWRGPRLGLPPGLCQKRRSCNTQLCSWTRSVSGTGADLEAVALCMFTYGSFNLFDFFRLLAGLPPPPQGVVTDWFFVKKWLTRFWKSRNDPPPPPPRSNLWRSWFWGQIEPPKKWKCKKMPKNQWIVQRFFRHFWTLLPSTFVNLVIFSGMGVGYDPSFFYKKKKDKGLGLCRRQGVRSKFGPIYTNFLAKILVT